jgi:ABC-type multidrug transport system fused ATPase/permease subunit
MEGRTTFVIAQRLSTLKHADEIVVLDHGRIVERGRHDVLLHNRGLYARIYDLQLRDQEELLNVAD